MIRSRLVVILLFLGLPGSVAAEELPFMLGVSQGSTAAVPVMKELGIHWGRTSVSLKELMPELSDPLYELKDVTADPGLVEEFSARADWSVPDAKIRYRLDNGIQPVVSVGHGWIGTNARYRGREAYPDRLGRDHYLAYMYLYTRAVVERYDGDGYLDAPGIAIKFWQTENELNQAALTAGWGWRKPEWVAGLVSAWGDWDFVTRVLATLYQAVHDADPAAQTMMNFHTDIHPKMNRMLGQPDWIEAVADWKDLMDVIAFDAYPNYYSAFPVRADVVGERVRTIREIVGDMPIVIMEIDYPYGPASRGFSPERQAEFLRGSYDAARAAGVAGYFKFRVADDDTEKYEKIELTSADLANLATIGPLYEQGQVSRILWWALPRAGYVRDHFLDALKSVEGHWGVIGRDGEKLPAYYTLRDIAAADGGGK